MSAILLCWAFGVWLHFEPEFKWWRLKLRNWLVSRRVEREFRERMRALES